MPDLEYRAGPVLTELSLKMNNGLSQTVEAIDPGLREAGSRSASASRRARRFQRADWEQMVAMVALLGDAVMILTGFLLAFWFRFSSNLVPSLDMVPAKSPPPSLESYLKLIAFGSFLVTLSLSGKNFYNLKKLLSPQLVVFRLVELASICIFIFIGVSLAVKTTPAISRLFCVYALCLILILVLAWRRVLSQVLQRQSILSRLQQRLVVIGNQDDAVKMQIGLMQEPGISYVGWIGVGDPVGELDDQDDTRLGDLTELVTLLRNNAVDMVLLANVPGVTDQAVGRIMKGCEDAHVQFRKIPNHFDVLVSALRPVSIGGQTVLGVGSLPLSRFSNRMKKRGMDILGALAGLVISGPIIALFTTLVYLESPGPVFYRQIRTGQNGRNFRIIKIRSMRLDAEKGGAQWAREKDSRRLRVGAFMRKWNIDETPQFWNVLKGEMSLAGPRPERPRLITKFKDAIPHYNARHMYPPGITGWAQVNGWRGNTSLEERIRHDIWYMENWTLKLDIKIMVQTFFRNKNAY